MITTISITLFTIFLSLSGIHIYWAFGGQWGNGAVIPTKDNHTKVMMPGLVPTLIVATGLLGFGLLILIESRLLNFNLPQWLSKYGLWVMAGILSSGQSGTFAMSVFSRNTDAQNLDKTIRNTIRHCVWPSE
jgi:hypothetical protein